MIKIKYSNIYIEHIKNKEVEHLEFKILQKYKDRLVHGFYLRKGGVSKGYYESLNLRTIGKDDVQNVMKNMEIISEDLGITPDNVYKALQDHTDNILVLDDSNKKNYIFHKLNAEEYDAYVTDKKDIATLITTADCNPIIIYDPVKNVVANIHSGWKGTVKKITNKTVNIMNEKFQSNPNDLIVCIGPSILNCCWTSEDQNLKQKFLEIWPYEDEYIRNLENGRYSVDFPYVIKKDLVEAGVKSENIVLSNICTCCNNDDFFSYRKTTMKRESDFATQATLTQLI